LILASIASLFAGVYHFKNRSKLKEHMQSITKTSVSERKRSLGSLGESVSALADRIGWTTDFDQFDKKLFLAGRPLNLSAMEFIGGWFVMVAAALLVIVVLSFLGAIPPFLALLIIAFAVLAPHHLITNASEDGRDKLSTEVIELVSKLELGVSAGLSPARVIEWAAEGEGMLAVILKAAIREISMGKLTHVIFAKIADDYNIPEAREVATSLKQAEVQGLNVAQALVELARDLRDRRERDADIQVVKLKPTLEGIMTAMVMVAAITLMVGPLVAENAGILDQMVGRNF
jgi:Flp pilus assembly protein TadB